MQDMQEAFERWQNRDKAALRELLRLACPELLQRASQIVGQNSLVEPAEVMGEAWQRILKHIHTERTPSLQHFWAYADHHLRWAMKDLIRKYWKYRKQNGQAIDRSDSGSNPLERPDSTDDPAKLVLFAEFHQEVEKLPDEEREVYKRRQYLDSSIAQIAGQLNLTVYEVKTRLVSAYRKLHRAGYGKFSES